MVMTEILQITSKLTELLDSQVPDSSHDFDPIKQVDDDDDDNEGEGVIFVIIIINILIIFLIRRVASTGGRRRGQLILRR